ncbi:MAG: Chalcone and stilbene synthase domain protein [Herminiimonas sp.]|nr:Chalcone and stilbene synthase domain protein [Herminiimonas sp.]
MFLSGLGTATPPATYTKQDCWNAFESSAWYDRLSPRARAIAQAVLTRDNGIESRQLALSSLDEVFHIDPDTLSQRFATHAPQLGCGAAQKSLRSAGLEPDQIDAVVVSTCTGYLCPGLSTYLIEGLGLRADVKAFDLVGQGCAAALPNMQLAQALVLSGQADHVLSVCVEVSSAAMYLDEDPGVLVSACLFGDGAGAAIWSREPSRRFRRVEWRRSASVTDPAQREALRFEQRQGLLRNVLTRKVPQLAATHAHALLEKVLAEAGVAQSEIQNWILHAGGRDVLQSLEKQFGVMPNAFRHSAAMLRRYGNLSSAFVYFVLEAALAESGRDAGAPDSGWWWLSSFGAGFSCHGALLAVA